MSGAFLEDLEVGQSAELTRTVADGDLAAVDRLLGAAGAHAAYAMSDLAW